MSNGVEIAWVEGEPWKRDVVLATVPGQVTGWVDACEQYQESERGYNAALKRYGAESRQAQTAACIVHDAMAVLFVAGGTAEDIDREQRAASDGERL